MRIYCRVFGHPWHFDSFRTGSGILKQFWHCSWCREISRHWPWKTAWDRRYVGATQRTSCNPGPDPGETEFDKMLEESMKPGAWDKFKELQ